MRNKWEKSNDCEKREREEVLLNFLVNHQGNIYRLAYSYSRNEDLAKDIIQESIKKGLVSLSNLKNDEAIKSWFYTILTRTAFDFIKKNKVDYVDLTENSEQSLNLQKNISLHEKLTLKDALGELKTIYREIIILKFFEGFTLLEISNILNMNINTVKSNFYRGLDELRELLK